MASSLCIVVDDTLGPHAKDCRGGFDLTLLFQELILAVPITALVLLAVPSRLTYLLRKGTPRVQRSCWPYLKLVSPIPRHSFSKIRQNKTRQDKDKGIHDSIAVLT